MKLIKGIILVAGVFVGVTACIGLQNDNKTNPGQGPVEGSGGFAVVELFTSEGCSSCPPADAVLDRIVQEYQGKEVYALAFHVDYWDHQGWKDRFSAREFTNRQRDYAEWLDLNTLYTPQVVVNGAREYVGSNRSAVESAIADGLDLPQTSSLVLRVAVGTGKVSVAYDVKKPATETETTLVLALVQKSAQSNVRAGENSGRKLVHVQVVRELVSVPLEQLKGHATLKLPDDFTESGWEVIGFVQRVSDGHITSAGRFDFSPASTAQKQE